MITYVHLLIDFQNNDAHTYVHPPHDPKWDKAVKKIRYMIQYNDAYFIIYCLNVSRG